MNDDEKRGYSKGYQAGQRRKSREDSSQIARALREDFTQRMMIAVAPQIISNPWGRTVNGEWKPNKGAIEIMRTVRSVAEAAAANCSFDDASAIEARRAETRSDSVHESATPQGDAQP